MKLGERIAKTSKGKREYGVTMNIPLRKGETVFSQVGKEKKTNF